MKPHPLESKPWKKPTPAKLPKARVMYSTDCVNPFAGMRQDRSGIYYSPVAVIPCHTAAQARQICKAAPFLRMTEEEKLEIVGEALYSDANWSSTWAETTPQVRNAYRLQAKAVLRAMNIGGAAR